MGYVLGILDTALEHALALKLEFDESIGIDGLSEDYEAQLTALAETHPHAQYALLLHLAMTMTLMTQDAFSQFCQHAWGSIPDKISRWTQTGQDWRKDQDA